MPNLFAELDRVQLFNLISDHFRMVVLHFRLKFTDLFQECFVFFGQVVYFFVNYARVFSSFYATGGKPFQMTFRLVSLSDDLVELLEELVKIGYVTGQECVLDDSDLILKLWIYYSCLPNIVLLVPFDAVEMFLQGNDSFNFSMQLSI